MKQIISDFGDTVDDFSFDICVLVASHFDLNVTY